MSVRRQERKEHPELKKTRWVWLKNEENQTDKEFEIYESLKNMNWKTDPGHTLEDQFPGVLCPAERNNGGVLEKVVFLGDPQPLAADDQGGQDDQRPLEWHTAVV